MSEIRKRDEPQHGAAGSRDLSAFVGKANAEKINKQVERVTALFDAIYPLFHWLGVAINAVWPYCSALFYRAQDVWRALQPYHPWELSTALMGLLTAFFGARYVLLLGAIEAAKQTGFERFATHARALHVQYRAVLEQHVLDNARDDDNNGVKDVEELTRKELFTRKFKLLLRSADPEAVSGAAMGLWTLFLGIVASLRLQFAQTVMLGVAISEAMQGPAMKYIAPHVAAGIAPDYRRWTPLIVRQTCRFIGVWLAFWLARLQIAFYSSSRGGHVFATGLLAYLGAHGKISPSLAAADGLVCAGLALFVAALGLYFQLTTFFALPFPLSFLLWPLSVAENILLYFVASGVQTGQPITPPSA